MQEKIRHLQHNMYIDGMGVILLGLWSALKVFAIMAEEIRSIENSYALPGQIFLTIKIIASVMIFIFILLIWLYHYYVGSGAIKAGKGRTMPKIYYFWTVVFLLINIFGLPSYFFADHTTKISDTGFAAMLVDFTIIFIVIDLLSSARRLKKLKNT